MTASTGVRPNEHRSFRDKLLSHGLLIDMGVDGLYGRSGTFEHTVDRINAAIGAVGDLDAPEVMRFPPGIGRWQLERSGYLRSFPHLAGTVHSFNGSDSDHTGLLETLGRGEDWTSTQTSTEIALAPAACYAVYPTIAARGRLAESGALVDVYAYCFRHEPSIDPARQQMFRQREHVRIATPGQVHAFLDLWMSRARTLFESFGLPCEVTASSDPFFGRSGKLLAVNQREEGLKFELLVPIASAEHPTACVSFNYHRDLFGRAWRLETAAGELAHTGCVGFGVERIALALFKHHGFSPEEWPRKVRDALGL